MKIKKILIGFILISNFLFSQKNNYSVATIADSLKQNANAVIRFNQVDIDIKSQREMLVHTTKIITVFNEHGLSAIDAMENYSKKRTISEINAIVFDAFGNEIKKIKRKDFRDQAVLDGITVFSDNRFIYLDYTPTQYPFTIQYESKVETSNTAFMPSWMPITDYFVSIEKSVLNVNYPNNLGFKKSELNFNGFSILKKSDTSTQTSYITTNISAIKPETHTPSTGFLPKLMMGLETFNLEGVDGNAKSWQEFGKWYSDKILSGTINLPESTKTKIKTLVGNETDPIEKAKIIYKYVQDKSRYVSIQVGIGGWKPMLAEDVDRLGYGDCKALSNYTKALLEVVNVPSYNTILYGDRNKRNIQSDFVSMQGNHMILCIPSKEKNIFLECTSQTDPFGYQGIFTDDRDVLIIKPEGGEIVHTTIYKDENNTQNTIGNYTINDEGMLLGSISMVCNGTQYIDKSRIESMLPTEKEAKLKEYWDNINNLKLLKTEFINDKENISFTENINMTAENYSKSSGQNMIFVTNAFNQYNPKLKKIRNRKTPFEIQRGFVDNDQITITLPNNYQIESIPQNFELKSKFGEYKAQITKIDEHTLLYSRIFNQKSGLFLNTEYEEYRLFIEQIARNDNSKIVLLKS